MLQLIRTFPLTVPLFSLSAWNSSIFLQEVLMKQSSSLAQTRKLFLLCVAKKHLFFLAQSREFACCLFVTEFRMKKSWSWGIMILSEYEVPYSQPKGYLLHLLFWTPYLGWLVPRTIIIIFFNSIFLFVLKIFRSIFCD